MIKTKRRILSIVLALVMVLGMVPFAAMTSFAAGPQKIGDSDVTWELTNSNTILILGGTGAMPNLSSGSAPWYSNKDSITSVVVNSGVTSIGTYAFYSHGNLQSVTIPSSVTSIGDYAFTNCSSITELNIDSIESWCGIGFDNFDSNPLYKGAAGQKVYVNGTEIGGKLVIPNTVTAIPTCAFYGWKNLTSAVIKASSVPNFSTGVFKSTNLTNIYVPYNTADTYKSISSLSDVADKIKNAYMVDVASTTNGTVSVSKDCFPVADYTTATETVTVNVTPDEGYQLKKLVWNDGTDHNITEAKSFTMPLNNVTVKAEFEENVETDITNIESEPTPIWTPATYDVTVTDRAIKIQFVDANGNTWTFARTGEDLQIHDGFKIVPYDKDGNVLESSESRELAYEVWTVTANLPAGDYKVKAKYSGSGWQTDEAKFYDYTTTNKASEDVAVVSAELESTSGPAGRVTATVITGAEVQKVQLAMNGTTNTSANAVINPDGTKTFTLTACTVKGDNTISVNIKYDNQWHDNVKTLTYTAE